ncbi:hypothetical protein ACE4Z2_25510, partial [Salmonella enterica]
APTAQAAPEDTVSPARLRADVERLVAFGTRHTLSTQTDPHRGIGAARTWAEAQLRAACGDAVQIVTPDTTITGERVSVPTRLVDV